jgi:hypothetical protein
MNYSDSQKIKSLIETFDKIDINEYHYFIKQLKNKQIQLYSHKIRFPKRSENSFHFLEYQN